MNVATGKDDNLHDVFDLYYVELQKFSKQYNELSNALDRWLMFLTRAHEMKTNHVPQAMEGDPLITRAIEEVDRMFNEDERKIYDIRKHAMMDVASQIASARKAGIEEGRQEGVEQGKNQMVLKAHQTGLSAIAIAEMFDLSLDQVKKWLA